jgi:hypothetical protein
MDRGIAFKATRMNHGAVVRLLLNCYKDDDDDDKMFFLQ